MPQQHAGPGPSTKSEETPPQDDQVLAPLRSHFSIGFPSWISVGEGWWPLLIELDQVLQILYPPYSVAQVKEKYGTLRFYLEDPAYVPLECCTKVSDDASTEEWLSHEASPEHQEKEAAAVLADIPRQQRHELMRAVITRYEQASSLICETCGKTGSLEVVNGWWATACPEHSREKS
jgi:hypothetical protein